MYSKPRYGSSDLGSGAVTTAKRLTFDANSTGKVREALVFLTFPEREGGQDALVSVQHTLGRTPKLWTVVGSGIDSDPSSEEQLGCCTIAGRADITVPFPGSPDFKSVHKGDMVSDLTDWTTIHQGTTVLDINPYGNILIMSHPAKLTWGPFPAQVSLVFTQSTARAPGQIYTDNPAPFTRNSVAFRCTVPFTWAKIALR